MSVNIVSFQLEDRIWLDMRNLVEFLADLFQMINVTFVDKVWMELVIFVNIC